LLKCEALLHLADSTPASISSAENWLQAWQCLVSLFSGSQLSVREDAQSAATRGIYRSSLGERPWFTSLSDQLGPRAEDRKMNIPQRLRARLLNVVRVTNCSPDVFTAC